MIKCHFALVRCVVIQRFISARLRPKVTVTD
jgi:hypothetical protein